MLIRNQPIFFISGTEMDSLGCMTTVHLRELRPLVFDLAPDAPEVFVDFFDFFGIPNRFLVLLSVGYFGSELILKISSERNFITELLGQLEHFDFRDRGLPDLGAVLRRLTLQDGQSRVLFRLVLTVALCHLRFLWMIEGAVRSHKVLPLDQHRFMAMICFT